MLVLTRKNGESIRIGDNIILKVIETENNHVKLGIEAPRDISVNREEIYQKIQEENKAASGGAKDSESIKDIADLLKNKNK
ncbi:MAG: carbon storage regulator CsrA [Chitinivibrionales bacterium]